MSCVVRAEGLQWDKDVRLGQLSEAQRVQLENCSFELDVIKN